MASPADQLNSFVQSVYLVIKGRYFDDLTSEDGQNLIAQTIDWTNQFLDELETTTDPTGAPVDWRWSRVTGQELGTATAGEAAIDFDTSQYLNLIAEEERYVQVLQDGSVVANFAVVDPSEISSKTDRITEDMCSLIGDQIIFSRVFNDQENGGTIIGDVTTPLPRMTSTNVKVLNLVRPKQLLILGVAKNASLPDIVKGKLSPNYAQKYDNLLQNAIAFNSASGAVGQAERDDFSYIGGIW